MTYRMRKLNDKGVRQFGEYLAGGATGNPPLDLLDNPETSEPLVIAINPGSGLFPDRYEFGIYLKTLLGGFDPASIAGDRHFWTSLALFWFDRICPAKADGTREILKEYHYILSSDYRHYYRHLIRSPWYLVRQHGPHSRFLLVASQKKEHPLSVHGEILEQIGGRQQVLASRPIIEAAARLYLDPSTGRPRKGVAGSGRGSARRFGIVLRQLDLTYDPQAMPDGGLLRILPPEFEKWKKHAAQTSRAASVNDTGHKAQPIALSA
jgi:hypothetical protein